MGMSHMHGQQGSVCENAAVPMAVPLTVSFSLPLIAATTLARRAARLKGVADWPCM